MKYFLSFAALTLGALAQQPLPVLEPSPIPENFHPLEKQHQPEPEMIIDPKNSMIQQPQISPEWAIIDNGNYTPEHPIEPQQPRHIKDRPEGKHHKRQHENRPRLDQNDMSDPAEGWNRGPRDEFNGPIGMPGEEEDEQFFNEHEGKEGGHFKGRKKFMKEKGVGHILFFVILGLLSLFLVKKCIKKHKKRFRQRQAQLPTDPSMIDEKINQHYAEIQRLTQMKNQMQRQVPVEPIIYHQTFPQKMEMTQQSHGRMVNENSYPVNQPQNVQYQQIPVGRPVIMGNPYNHQQFYRTNQF